MIFITIVITAHLLNITASIFYKVTPLLLRFFFILLAKMHLSETNVSKNFISKRCSFLVPCNYVLIFLFIVRASVQLKAFMNTI